MKDVELVVFHEGVHLWDERLHRRRMLLLERRADRCRMPSGQPNTVSSVHDP